MTGDAGVMFLDILPAFCSISETDSSVDVASVDLACVTTSSQSYSIWFSGCKHVCTFKKLNLKCLTTAESCDNQAALHSLNKLVHHEMLSQQNLPQIIPQRHSSMLLVCSGWFMSILDFLYGSLPRPPDILLDISFSPLYFILCSSCPR
ncbi:hypothetical protein F2Q69_00000643 [Brassica cretica]|uniref:Uncharacterized protein n=1 Tax=Brassica cretica TaxID=69181 RepID=A0A8S9P5J3_BRACR|nr:hypothetical protein F2Q69_00000643 [Brassica cretica]